MPSIGQYPADTLENESELTTKLERFFVFIRRRFVRKQRNGLSLTVGIVIVALFLLAFFFILQNYHGQDKLIQADTRIENLIYTLRSEELSDAMLLITLMGTWQIIFTGIIVIGFPLFALNLIPYLLALVISVSGGEIISSLIKNLVERPRPPVTSALIIEKSFSFPSGHTLVAVAFYGFLAYTFYRLGGTKRAKTLSIILGGTAILAIAFSRLYLGIHWPSDILASLALGGAWLCLVITGLKFAQKSIWTKGQAAIIGKRFIVVPTAILLILWLAYIGYFFSKQSLLPQAAVVQNPIHINEKDIPNELFSILPRFSETLTGSPMEPINIIIVGDYDQVLRAFHSAGWFQPDPITLRTTWKTAVASILNKPYPRNIESPAFWNSKPNDFAFQLPTATVRQRHHVHFWSTPLLTDQNHRVWFATAHFDKAINFKTIVPSHHIDPYIDNERETIKKTVAETGQISEIREFQVTQPGQGKNLAGDKFFTNGEAYVLFLKDE
ncbi:MAG: LssY C-terminal domain-containing protein [bacterium]|nr:LssY C-terminal domain-containing protein [bacterium]